MLTSARQQGAPWACWLTAVCRAQAELHFKDLQANAETRELQLHALKDGKELSEGLGALYVAVWMAPDQGRSPSVSTGAVLRMTALHSHQLPSAADDWLLIS